MEVDGISQCIKQGSVDEIGSRQGQVCFLFFNFNNLLRVITISLKMQLFKV
jgi:hypothetical protein